MSGTGSVGELVKEMEDSLKPPSPTDVGSSTNKGVSTPPPSPSGNLKKKAAAKKEQAKKATLLSDEKNKSEENEKAIQRCREMVSGVVEIPGGRVLAWGTWMHLCEVMPSLQTLHSDNMSAIANRLCEDLDKDGAALMYADDVAFFQMGRILDDAVSRLVHRRKTVGDFKLGERKEVDFAPVFPINIEAKVAGGTHEFAKEVFMQQQGTEFTATWEKHGRQPAFPRLQHMLAHPPPGIEPVFLEAEGDGFYYTVGKCEDQ